ncbi:unnamed protein product [Prunus brigantina]
MEIVCKHTFVCNVVDKAELCTLELHHFGLLENGVYKGGKVLMLYYHDPTHNNELESEDKEQQHHREDVGNEEEEEEEVEEDEEKEDVIVDSDYELSEEENATWEISNDDEDSDRLPSNGGSSGGEEDGQKKTSKRKWKKPNFKQFRKETDLRNSEFRIGIMQFANKDELKEAIREYAIVQGMNVKLVKNDNKRI